MADTRCRTEHFAEYRTFLRSLGGDNGETMTRLRRNLHRAVREEPTLEKAALRCKSRRYALSRIRRMLLGAALGLEKGMNRGTPPYLRVLAADKRGCEVLAAMKKHAILPIISKAGTVRTLPEEAQAVFELGSRAHDLWVLGRKEPDLRRGDEDFHLGSRILTDEPRKIAD